MTKNQPTVHDESPPAPLVVPYITKWSAEGRAQLDDLRMGADGRLGYRTEHPQDRDGHGVLWVRMSDDFGEGEPEFKRVHSERQRTAMQFLSCQVCTRPSSRMKAGVLFLQTGRWSAEQIEDEPTGQPPLCLPCAQIAREQCPRLRAYTAVRARKCPPWGVTGFCVEPDGKLPTYRFTRYEPEDVAYGEPQIRRVLAHHMLRTLRRVTLVDLDAELHQAGLLEAA